MTHNSHGAVFQLSMAVPDTAHLTRVLPVRAERDLFRRPTSKSFERSSRHPPSEMFVAGQKASWLTLHETYVVLTAEFFRNIR